MSYFKPVKLTSAQVENYPIKDGQLIITTDVYGFYLDDNNTGRISISEIQRLTEGERSDLLIPVKGFYYTTDNHELWSYDTEWTNLTSSENILSHLTDYSNPHKVTKLQIGLSKVENKSSTEILSELTHDNVVNALGYEPPTQDTTYGIATSTVAGVVKSGTQVMVMADGTMKVLGGIADQLSSERIIALAGAVTGSIGFDGTQDVTITTVLSSIPAEKITGVLSIDNIPKGAIERCVVVADDAARFALTTDDVQKGDTVKVGSDDTAKMYMVIDDTNLSTEAGYEVYRAGSAASVPWIGITGKPSVFSPEEHSHTVSEITDFPTSMPASDVYDWAKAATKPTYTKDEIGLSNVTNDAQIKGLTSGTTENHVVVFGADGYTVKDSGFTIEASVPAGAKFTDTVYTHPTYTAHTIGFYKFSIDETGHIASVSEVTSDDIESLMDSISINIATSTKPGVILSGGDIEVVEDTGEVTVKAAGKLRSSVKIGEADFDGSTDLSLADMGIKNPIEITKAEYEALKAAGTLNMSAYYNIIDDYDSVGLIDDLTPATNQVFSSNKTESTYSKKSTVVDATLLASGWSGTTAPYSYSLSVAGVTATNVNEISYSLLADDSAIESYQNAMLKDGGQSAGQIILLATGDKPTIDIPITVIVRNDI